MKRVTVVEQVVCEGHEPVSVTTRMARPLSDKARVNKLNYMVGEEWTPITFMELPLSSFILRNDGKQTLQVSLDKRSWFFVYPKESFRGSPSAPVFVRSQGGGCPATLLLVSDG
jgi:hypothetical protein